MQRIATERGFDVVVHLAGVAGWCDVAQGVDVNVAGTQNIVAAMQEAGTRKFVVASSVAVTGSCAPDFPPQKLPITSDHGFVGSQWAYALSKAMVEQLITFMAGGSSEGSDFLLVRIGCVVTDPPAPLLHLETALDEKTPIEAAEATETPKTATFPEAPLCAIALSDITRCLVLAAEAPIKPGVRTITAVGPTAFSRAPVAEVMASWYKDGGSQIANLQHYADPAHAYDPIYDTSAAREELGFEAAVDLRKACL